MNLLPFAGAAALLTLAVLTWLLYPLLNAGRERSTSATRRALNAAIYRDQLADLENDRALGHLAEADYAQARDELQHRLLQDTALADTAPAPAPNTHPTPATRSALLLALFLPMAAVGLYLWLGHPAALQPPAVREQITSAQIDDMVARLAARMEKNPDDLKGWMMLARSYKALHRYDDGARAYERILALGGKDANILADYADLLAARAEGKFDKHMLELLDEALKLDPDNTMALALAGSAAYNRQDFAATARYWDKLLTQLPADSDEARSLSAALEEVHAKRGDKKAPATPRP
ncbi:MAG: c-type cytochrome biogenesis protein CcmI [Sterolibacterium sp.]|jgi:cytochrome c-type biogenesis protein CcmH|nr:c-type cytochrome biogenesis protein CcmI [Sterolibacterium sp.]